MPSIKSNDDQGKHGRTGSRGPKKAGTKFRLDGVQNPTRRHLVEAFCLSLRQHLSSVEQDAERGTKAIMREVSGKARELKLSTRDIDPRQFWPFLRQAYQDAFIRIKPYRASDLESKLQEKLGTQMKLLVVGGCDASLFAQAAAESFIKEIVRLGAKKKLSSTEPLNVGIVSGGTTGAVIESLCSLDWVKDFGIDLEQIPAVRVLALNVCLTGPDHLSGNANVLAHMLAEKVKKEGGKRKTFRPEMARAFGLMARLLVEKEELRRVDAEPQTYDVVKITEPFRVKERYMEEFPGKVPGEYDTHLDIVLTGVGELPKGTLPKGTELTRGGSIFYELAEQFGIDMGQMITRHRIVGDMAFTALRSDGEPVPLFGPPRTVSTSESKESFPGSSGDLQSGMVEQFFYSAVQLPILERMKDDPENKSVILVARSTKGKDKIPAIYASVAGRSHRYASMLIVDEQIAEDLKSY